MNTAIPRVDWLSFTIPVPISADYGLHKKRIVHYLAEAVPELPSMEDSLPRPIGGRPPYNTLVSNGDGISVLLNPIVAHALCEVSGRGCTALGHDNIVSMLYRYNVIQRLTRLDLALDIETPTRPREVLAAGLSARFTSHRIAVSESGETVYIGSPQSDRMVRVYRYEPPHDRAHLLRFEYVLRRDAAKAGADDMLQYGIEHTIGGLERMYDWKHPDARQYRIDRRLTTPRNDKGAVTRLWWLRTQVLPAMHDMERAGVLPPSFWAYMAELFPDRIKPPQCEPP